MTNRQVQVPVELLETTIRYLDNVANYLYLESSEVPAVIEGADCLSQLLQRLIVLEEARSPDGMDQLRQDAERYRYAAEHLWIGEIVGGRTVEEWGTSDIDAAMRAEAGEEG